MAGRYRSAPHPGRAPPSGWPSRSPTHICRRLPSPLGPPSNRVRQCLVMMPPRLTTGARPLRSPTGSPPEPAPSHSRELTDGAGAPDTSPAPSVGGTTPHALGGARRGIDTGVKGVGPAVEQPADAP